MSARRRNRQNRKKGSSIIEAPVILWVIFAFMLVPMLSMASVTLRASLLNYLVVQGVHAASKAKTFETADPGKKPAIVIAENTITAALGRFSGITVNSIDTDILASSLTGSSVTRFPGKLPAPANTETNVYQIETRVQGQVAPLLGRAPNFGSGIPGLTAPIVLTCAAREMFENPQGLNR